MRLFLLTLAMACWGSVYAFDDVATALETPIVIPGDATGVTANIIGATPSAEPSCLPMEDDVWFYFTTNTTAVRVKIFSQNIDVRFEVYDSGMTSLACINEFDDFTKESVVLSALTNGETYYVRVASDGTGQSLGTVTNVVTQFYYTYDPVLPVPVNDECGWNTNSTLAFNNFVEASNWEWEITNYDGAISTYLTNSNANFTTLGIANPQAVPGESFQIRVRCYAGGNWCPWSNLMTINVHPVPKTKLKANFCDGVYDLNDFIICEARTAADFYTFRFTADNGNTQLEGITSNNSVLPLSTMSPDLRYGKTYQVDVKVQINGVEGPYTDVCSISTIDFPYTYVEEASCTGDFLTVVPLEFIPGATSYSVRVYPTDPEDPFYFPIGPAQVFETPTSLNVASLTGVQTAPNTTYVVQAKGHVSEQEGDYGPVCLFTTDALVNNEDEESETDENDLESIDFLTSFFDYNFEKVSVGNYNIYWKFKTTNANAQINRIDLFNSSGQILTSINGNSNSLNLDKPSASGLFIARVVFIENGLEQTTLYKLIN